MKLKPLLLTILMGCCLTLSAQNIVVKSFKALPMDMTASSLEGKRQDQNGEAAALIKVVTSEKGLWSRNTKKQIPELICETIVLVI